MSRIRARDAGPGHGLVPTQNEYIRRAFDGNNFESFKFLPIYDHKRNIQCECSAAMTLRHNTVVKKMTW